MQEAGRRGVCVRGAGGGVVSYLLVSVFVSEYAGCRVNVGEHEQLGQGWANFSWKGPDGGHLVSL